MWMRFVIFFMAFVAASVLTDRFCIATKGAVNFEFSAEDILTCCLDKCHLRPENQCAGGRMDKAWDFLTDKGAVSGGEYMSNEGCKPISKEIYEDAKSGGCKTACTNKNYAVPYQQDKKFLKHKIFIWTTDVDEIQREIMMNGPMQTTMDVFDDFKVYKEGVYFHTKGDTALGHSVKLIGWGVENDLPYWLGVNTWGDKWGMKGIFKILRGQDECDIETYIAAGIPNLQDFGSKKEGVVVPTSEASSFTKNSTSSGMRLSPRRFVIFANIFILYKYVNPAL